ncbi:MAG: hypothetical protein KGZ83_00270 [Sulfuricella sp.]|nr:hypothetical protein [Sulfuricella sp.]
MRNDKIDGRLVAWKRVWWAFTLCLLGSSLIVHSSQERYDYDALGRLIRSIGGQGQATEYLFDAVGNLLQVTSSGAGAVLVPTITSITPASVQPGQTALVTIVGTGLSGAAVTPSAAALDVSAVLAGSTQISFFLTVAQDATVGQQSFKIASAAGVTTANISIVGVPPKMLVEPMPLAIPPDNVGRNFTIRLSKPDVVDNVITLVATNQNIAVSPATVTIRAGDTAAIASVKGVAAGVSAITLSSAGMASTSIPVYVTSEFVGISTGYAAPLGVLFTPPQSTGSGVPQMLRGILGVAVGKYLGGVSPQFVAVGTTATLTLTGAGLETVGSVAVSPSDGVTLGTPQPAPDGKSLSLPIVVAADAPAIVHRLVVKDTLGVALIPSIPNADRFLVGPPAPEIQSVDPLVGVVGTNVILTVRGRNLSGVQSIAILPIQGISFGGLPTLSADGTALTTQIAIAPDAALGQRTVVLNAPSGSSSSAPVPANTFTVALQAGQTFAPFVSAPLGVTLASSTPSGAPMFKTSPTVGVTFGRTVTGISPKVGIIGSSMSLVLQGSDLNGVSAVQFAPATGITAGAPAVSADGKTVTVDLTIAADAPQTVRAITVLAGSARVPFAQGDGDRFSVSVPLPRIDGIDPIVLQVGQVPKVLNVYGANLQNISAVNIIPGTGITVGVPSVVNAQGTQATVSISALASAATGPRLVTVTAPTGQSGSDLLPGNTLTLVNSAPSPVSPVLSAPLGVSIAPPLSSKSLPVYGRALGVTLQKDVVPASTSILAKASVVGVALGSVALDRAPAALMRGATATLMISGAGLDKASAIRLDPVNGITLGTPSIASDGTSISVPLTIAADAATGKRKIVITTLAGSTIAFADALTGTLQVGVGAPQLDSVTPILAKQGDRVTLLVRGRNFNEVQAVAFTPPDGIIVFGTPVADSTGTQIPIDVQVLDGAPLGSRVLQVAVPGGISSDIPVPANTFTVYAK